MGLYSYRSAQVEAQELQRIVAQENGVGDYASAESLLEKRYVSIREASDRLNEQNQYTARYLEGTDNFPDLGRNIRYGGDPADYHNVKIHEDDVATFVARILVHKDRSS